MRCNCSMAFGAICNATATASTARWFETIPLDPGGVLEPRAAQVCRCPGRTTLRSRALVTEIRKLYLIERHARDEGLSAEQRGHLRAELAAPILVGLKPRLEALAPGCLPKSPLGKAIRYTLAEWGPLTRYLQDGRLEIDNNLTENAIRPSAVGKKNWLFIGHPEAGWRSAVIYSVIVSCRRRGIDPWEYLSDVLRRLPAMKHSEVPTLLPRCWKPIEPGCELI